VCLVPDGVSGHGLNLTSLDELKKMLGKTVVTIKLMTQRTGSSRASLVLAFRSAGPQIGRCSADPRPTFRHFGQVKHSPKDRPNDRLVCRADILNIERTRNSTQAELDTATRGISVPSNETIESKFRVGIPDARVFNSGKYEKISAGDVERHTDWHIVFLQLSCINLKR
jgi:hypothetical protein